MTKANVSVYEAKWTTATKKAYYAEHPENFAGPDMSFPIKDASDVGDAWGLAGHADDPDAVRTKIIAIAKRLKITHGLPDTAKDDDDKEESAVESVLLDPVTSGVPTANRPRQRIATIQVCWIEDGARSLNGRIYPQETVSRLIASGQRKIADPDALPVTCFLSHADADNDHIPALIGKVTQVWREGSKGMASIDLADTSHAKDALGLISGGYLRTESLRASNAELRVDAHYDAPVVGGNDIELDGIDLTNYPGLEACARIQQVQIAESANDKPTLQEIFDLPPQAVALHEVFNSRKDSSMTKRKITEADQGGNTVGGYQPTSGNTVGTTDDPTQDDYSKALYHEPPMTTGAMQGMTQVPEIMEAHDRIAMVQGRACAPGKESARYKAAFASLSESERAAVLLREAGKPLSKKNDGHLDVAHHALAKVAALECEGVDNKMGASASDPDGDGDDDTTNDPTKNPDWALDQLDNNNMESSKKRGNSPMTEEELLKSLEARGYTFQRPKTEAEKLQEQMAALQAEHAKQLEEMKAMITASQQPKVEESVPQRKSLVSGSNVGENSRSIRGQLYHNGQYLHEKIAGSDWEQLADRTCPLPEGIEIEHLIKEFEHLYAVQYDDRFQVLSATELR